MWLCSLLQLYFNGCDLCTYSPSHLKFRWITKNSTEFKSIMTYKRKGCYVILQLVWSHLFVNNIFILSWPVHTPEVMQFQIASNFENLLVKPQEFDNGGLSSSSELDRSCASLQDSSSKFVLHFLLLNLYKEIKIGKNLWICGLFKIWIFKKLKSATIAKCSYLHKI